MTDQNAYFQLHIEPNGVSLVLYPKRGSGKDLDYKEVEEYLINRNYMFDRKTLLPALAALDSQTEIKLFTERPVEEDESLDIQIASDKLSVFGRFYPPSQKGRLLTKEDIIQAMVSKGVKYGARQENIQSFLSDRAYCKDYELAAALPPVEGRHAAICYFFNTDPNRKPRTNEDGSVDFHHLDNIVHVTKDTLLAELVPAVKGQPGINVCGVGIKPMSVQHKVLKYGNNIHINEEQTKIYSKVDGHVNLIEDTVFVSDVFEAVQDIDASTGNISYEGSVKVNGNVRAGYSVFAKGDIIVNGVVEGAFLEAGGQIIVKLGIQGMNRAVLKAGSNVVAKFIESADITSGGYVTTECILHSKVAALGDILVNGRRGFISGGEVRSASMIQVKTAGSTMGTSTVLEVGVNPMLLDAYRQMEKELPALKAELLGMEQNMAVLAKRIEKGEKLAPDKVVYLRNAIPACKQIEQKITDYQDRMQVLQADLNKNEFGCIKISDTIHPGCKMVISGAVQFVRTVTKHCRYVREGADLKMLPY